MDSCFAAWMKPQVLTTTPSAPSSARVQPAAPSRAASSSESTSFRAQPSVTRLTVRLVALDAGSPAAEWIDDTPADYGKPARGTAPAAGGASPGPPGTTPLQRLPGEQATRIGVPVSRRSSGQARG